MTKMEVTKVPVKLEHMMAPTLYRAAQVRGTRGHRKNIFLSGPMGSGKTTAGQQLAERLGLPFFYQGALVMPSYAVGWKEMGTGEWRKVAFVNAWLSPVGAVFMADELDGWSPNAQLALNGPLANGFLADPDGVSHARHPDFIFIGCGNTWGTGPTAEYVGRNRLDAAFMDRMDFRLQWGYDSKLESAAAGGDYYAREVADFIQIVRRNLQSNGIKQVVSPRATINIADMLRSGWSLGEAVGVTIAASLTPQQYNRVFDGTDEYFDELSGEDLLELSSPFPALSDRR